jgi:hypothetical protein
MAGSNLKSPSIANLDASPIVTNMEGAGAPGTIRENSDFVVPNSGDDNTSVYKIVRIPTAANLKAVYIMSKIVSAGSGDINIAYSDSTTDGTSVSRQGLIPQISAANNKLFGAAQSLVLAGVRTDFTYKGIFLPKHRNMELWAALIDLGCTEFTSDPGGCFDLQINITTAVTTGGLLSAEVWYVD